MGRPRLVFYPFCSQLCPIPALHHLSLEQCLAHGGAQRISTEWWSGKSGIRCPLWWLWIPPYAGLGGVASGGQTSLSKPPPPAPTHTQWLFRGKAQKRFHVSAQVLEGRRVGLPVRTISPAQVGLSLGMCTLGKDPLSLGTLLWAW